MVWIVCGIALLIALLVYLMVGYRALERTCSSDRFVIEHFGSDASGSFSMGISGWPPGFYCESGGERVVQLFPH